MIFPRGATKTYCKIKRIPSDQSCKESGSLRVRVRVDGEVFLLWHNRCAPRTAAMPTIQALALRWLSHPLTAKHASFIRSKAALKRDGFA